MFGIKKLYIKTLVRTLAGSTTFVVNFIAFLSDNKNPGQDRVALLVFNKRNTFSNKLNIFFHQLFENCSVSFCVRERERENERERERDAKSEIVSDPSRNT